VRVRLRFSKLGKIRFTSQRDVARMWERALRRAGLPIAYTGGFSPRPQLAFGPALPTGCESLAEYVDVVLDDGRPETTELDAGRTAGLAGGFLPAGIDIMAARVVDPRIASVQADVTSCRWEMSFVGLSRDELGERIDRFLAAPSVPILRERKGREELDDLRPSVLAIALSDPRGIRVDGGTPAGPVELVADLATRPRGVRPVEVTRALCAVSPVPGGGTVRAGEGGTLVLDRARRTQQWIERDGLRREPLEVGVPPAGSGRAVHALERAS